MRKLLIAAAAATLVCSAAGAASAATVIGAVYNLDVDKCDGTCGLAAGASYGTVTVMGFGTDTLTFDVQLDTLAKDGVDIYFTQAGGPTELFSLSGPSSIDVSSITSDPSSSAFAANPASGDETPGSYNGGGAFGDFAYEIKYVGPPANNGDLPSAAGFQDLQFTVAGASPPVPESGIKNGNATGTYFVADVYGSNGKTGNIGATFDHYIDGAPEPATWAMMMLGLFGLGAMLRVRRKGVGAAAAQA